MDALKLFESLPDSVKIKFFHSLESGSVGASLNQDGTCSSETSNLSSFLKNISGGNFSESNLQGENSKKKQTTLDGWLIKGDNGSSPRKKVEHSSSKSTKQSSVTSHSFNVSDISSHSEHIATDSGEDQNSVDSVSSGNKTSNESDRFVEESHININVPMKNVQADSSIAAERTKLTNEKYNLRSKRKASDLSPMKDDVSNKHFKHTDNNQVLLRISDHDKILDNTQTNLDGSNHQLNVVEKDSSNIDSSLEKKNCNQRTKKKNSRLLKSGKINNNITVQTESHKEIVDTVINNEPSLNTISAPQSSYEAFCLLSNECSKVGLNIRDILKHENIQTLLNKKKSLSDDAIVFIGCFETQTKKIQPVVHVAQSKKILQKKLIELRK